jgi:hypothetical protein
LILRRDESEKYFLPKQFACSRFTSGIAHNILNSSTCEMTRQFHPDFSVHGAADRTATAAFFAGVVVPVLIRDDVLVTATSGRR